MIPSVIYQTWKYESFPNELKKVQESMKYYNPNYTFEYFDEKKMTNWVYKNCDDTLVKVFKSLKDKSQLWRFLILYMNGGIYLDIHGEIVTTLSKIITTTDMAVVSRSPKLNIISKYFLTWEFDYNASSSPDACITWMLVFSPNHAILEKTIEKIINEAQKDTFDGTLQLDSLFTDVIVDFITPVLSDELKTSPNLLRQSDATINQYTNNMNQSDRVKFYSTDFAFIASKNSRASSIIDTL
jgi:mannosyltransferase OCH1-like enzyme